MKSLHDSTMSGWQIVRIWYQAYVSRVGRAHLWEVPMAPMTEDEQRQAETRYWRLRNGTGITFGDFMDSNPPPKSRRMCRSRQNARQWYKYDTRWRAELDFESSDSPRGFCQTCWNIYQGDRERIRFLQDSIKGWGTFTRRPQDEPRSLMEIKANWWSSIGL